MIPIPNDEMLMAYADDELDPDVAAAVERAMVRDPMIVIKAVEFLRSRRLARQRFAAEPLPVPSRELLSAAMGGEQRGVGATRLLQPGLRLLAASIMLVAAGVAGWALHDRPVTQTGISVLEQPQFTAALGRIASGETFEAEGATMRAIATMELPEERVCRQVEVDIKGEDFTGAVVCRGAGKPWATVLALRAPSRTDGYRPASGNEIIDKFLDDQKAGPALDAVGEKRALESPA